jgi:DHA1 family inner membrane transport protein
MPAVLGTLGALAIALFAIGPAIHNQATAVVMMFLFGMAAFAVVAPLQLRVMTAAGHAPDVASAANISAFTLGSALGIYLGGAAIDNGLGLTSVNWIGGLITTSGLLVAVLTRSLLKGRPGAEHHEPDHDHGEVDRREAVGHHH